MTLGLWRAIAIILACLIVGFIALIGVLIRFNLM